MDKDKDKSRKPPSTVVPPTTPPVKDDSQIPAPPNTPTTKNAPQKPPLPSETVTKDESRKPAPPDREPAQDKMNRFLKEEKIYIATKRPVVEFTNSGAMLIHSPSIVAVYEDEVKQIKKPTVN